ncbi:MAG: hypothetical protein ACPL4K_01575 [Candidatus Margulisiibacteriota bacterium]
MLFFPVFAQAKPLEAIYKNDYCLSIYPHYPPYIGDEITIRIKTFIHAQKVTVYTDRELEIPMAYRDGFWWGKFKIPDDYKEGGHFFTVWIRTVRFRPTKMEPIWVKSIIWYQMVKRPSVPAPSFVPLPSELTAEVEEALPVVTGEAVEIQVPTAEVVPFVIKGTKTLSFTSKSIEGSKEGFVPGVTREEALRLNISGKTDDTEVDATLISTSTMGTTQVAQREDKISVLVKKASTEAYLGDFTAELKETEFTKLNKVLSGVYVKGDYDRWGFYSLYSSPKGDAKFKRIYGNGTQGPYTLDFTPVVIDSERIYVDGVLQKRGDDYTIDYQAGTIFFTRRTIDPISILTIYYDYRETVYQHATYGLRLTAKPNSNLKLGATYLNDSDSLAGALEIRQNMTREAIDPKGHYVFGVDSSFISENFTFNSEVAYSNKNLNLLSSGSEEVGKAAKFDLSSQLGPLGISGYGKRVGAKFQPIAEFAPKQDVTAYGGSLGFRLLTFLGTSGNYNYEKYTQSGVVYENLYKSAKASLTPERWPSLEYNTFLNEESNDPVTGDPIKRSIVRDSVETNYQFGFLTTSVKGAREKWTNRLPSEEVTDYKKVNFGLATLGLEKISFTSNVGLEERKEPDGTTPYRKTYNLNLSATPNRSYFASVAIEYLDDSAQGVKNVTDLSYKAEPNEAFRTDGKYTVTTVDENFPISATSKEVVSKQVGSFSLDIRPWRYLRLRYFFKPNFTKILRTNDLSSNNEQQQAEINLMPVGEVFVGAIYKLGRAFDIKKDYNPSGQPNYTIKQNTSDTDFSLYTLKLAPFRIWSTEFNYLLENGRTTSLITAEPLSYLPGVSNTKKYDVLVKTSLTEKFSIDSRYTYQRSTQGTGEVTDNLVNSVSHTASLKGIWNVSEMLSLSISGAYTKAVNNLLANPITYTISPGFGLIYRQGERLRVDFNFTYSKSYAGAETQLWDYSLLTKYSLSDYVNVTLRGQRQISSQPDYKLTDLAGSVEINL